MNNDRRVFLKQSFVLISGTSLFGCGTDIEETSVATTKLLPSIIRQPSDKSVSAGKRATFQVLADGSEPFSYQWRKNTIDIIDATSPTYITPVLELVDTDSSYSVVVANENGQVISREAKLIVTHINFTIDQTSITIDTTQITIDGT